MDEREPDRQLVGRAQRGDKHAFELLVSKYQRKLTRLLARFIRDPVEVEDVAQEAFIKAYRALPSFRGDSAFYTWLYRIGINTAKNYLVALGRRAPTTTEFNSEDAEGFEDGEQLRDINTPESMMMTKEIAQTVNDTVERLPEELRDAITLRELEGLSYEDIATIMNCPIGTSPPRKFLPPEPLPEKRRPLPGRSKEKGGDHERGIIGVHRRRASGRRSSSASRAAPGGPRVAQGMGYLSPDRRRAQGPDQPGDRGSRGRSPARGAHGARSAAGEEESHRARRLVCHVRRRQRRRGSFCRMDGFPRLAGRAATCRGSRPDHGPGSGHHSGPYPAASPSRELPAG